MSSAHYPARRKRAGKPAYAAIVATLFLAAVLLLSLNKAEPGQESTRGQAHKSSRPLRLSVIVKTGAATANHRLPSHLFPTQSDKLLRHRQQAEAQDGAIDLPQGANIPTHVNLTTKPQKRNNSKHAQQRSQAVLQHYFVSDHSTRIGDVDVVDVLANLSHAYKVQTRFRAYDDLHKQLASGKAPSSADRKYWQLDKFKFVPMHRYAYEQDSSADFHVAIDDDTYIFWPTLVRWLAENEIKPSDPHYIGHRLGNMAYGGAGYLVSQALLRATYGSTPSPRDFENRPDVVRAVAGRWCGDCALSDVFGNTMGHLLPKGRTTAGQRAFVPSLAEIVVSDETWQQPVCSIHRLLPDDYAALRQLEGRLHGESVRVCDIVSALAPPQVRRAFEGGASDRDVRARDWIIENADLQTRFSTCDAGCLKQVKPVRHIDDEQACAEMCNLKSQCLAWTLRSDVRECDLYEQQFSVGRTRKGSVSGWHAERLRKRFSTDKCHGKSARAQSIL